MILAILQRCVINAGIKCIGPNRQNAIIVTQVAFQNHLNKNLQENKMTDGLNLDGFTANRKPAGTHNIGEQYAADPKSAIPATDVSNQASAQGPK